MVERIGALVDATHPFAPRCRLMRSQPARGGDVRCSRCGGRLGNVAGDRWIEVDDIAEAVHALGAAPRRVFLTLGRKEIAPFAARRTRYLVRSVDPVEPPLDVPHATYIVARGPFTVADERALIEMSIDTSSPRTAAAAPPTARSRRRERSASSIMVRRPVCPSVAAVETVEEALAWLDHALALRADRGV